MAHTDSELSKLKKESWWPDMKEAIEARNTRLGDGSAGEPFRVMLILQEAKVLVSTDSNGLSDPYIRVVNVDGVKMHQTDVRKKTLSPQWNETVLMSVYPNDPIGLLLYDKDMLSSTYNGAAAVIATCGSDGKLVPQKDVTIQVFKTKVHKDGSTSTFHHANIVYSLTPCE